MCLAFDKTMSEKWIKEQKDSGIKHITCYKVVRLDRTSWFFGTTKKYKKGRVFYSNRTGNRFLKNAFGEHVCSTGIHVFTTESKAVDFQGDYNCTPSLLIEVKCYLKDFVAYDNISKEAVFTKVTTLT